MTGKNNPISRHKDLIMQEAGGEILIYDLKTNKAFCLNEISALVWQSCNDGQKSVSEISQEMSRKLKTKVTEDLVWLAIDQLKKDDLLVNAGEIPAKFKGLSRREVIRRVGLASLVMMPIITSLVAPTPSHAASGGGAGGVGQTCTTDIPGTQGSCGPGLRCSNSTGSFKCCFAASTPPAPCTLNSQCCSGNCCDGACIDGDCGEA